MCALPRRARSQLFKMHARIHMGCEREDAVTVRRQLEERECLGGTNTCLLPGGGGGGGGLRGSACDEKRALLKYVQKCVISGW